MKFSLFILLIFTSAIGFSQGYNVDGTVNDGVDHSTLTGAIVKLVYLADTTRWTGAATDQNGKFQFTNLPIGNYKLVVSYIGYKPMEKKVIIAGEDKHMGSVMMVKGSTNLRDVPIVGHEDRVTQKEDTSEYNAKAYKVNPDATAEDLVTKMPGITSVNGTVTAQGETVQQVYVDGKEFFGQDATLAIKNLPAEIIDKIQVFDHMSDQAQFTGFDDGNTQKAINIVTKKGRNNGIFGKLYAGYGYVDDNRYSVGGNVNWFDGERRLSIIGMSNNVNLQNFATQDLLGVIGTSTQRQGAGMNGGYGGNRGAGGGGAYAGGGGGGGGAALNNFLVGQQGGISTTTSLGANYTDLWFKKLKVTASYFFNLTNNVTNTTLTRQYFNAGDSSTYYKETDNTPSTNANHRLSLRMEYDFDSMNKLIFTPRINIQSNTQTTDQFGQTYIGQTELEGQAQNTYYGHNYGYNITGNLLFQHKFKKPHRTFSVNVSTTINNKKGNTSLNSNDLYYDPDTTILLNQQAALYNYSYSASVNFAYTEPVGKTGMLQFTYNPANTWNTSSQLTYNYDSLAEAYTAFDTGLSNKYNNIYMTQKAGVSYRFTNKTILLMFGVNAQYALLNGQEYFPTDFFISRTFFNVLPQAAFTYRFKNKSNLRILYHTSTNPPSITQLQNVINNSNPLILSTGNPNLKQAYSHSLVFRYGTTNSKTAQAFFAFASVTYTQNYVGNSTVIADSNTILNPGGIMLQRGSQLILPVNLSEPNVAVNTFFTYGLPLDKIKSNLNLTWGFNVSHTPGLINNVSDIANNYSPSAGIVLGSNISEKIDFTISYTANYNVLRSSLQASADNAYFTHTGNVKFNWLFYKGFVFNTTLQNVLYTGIQPQGFNEDLYLWNLALGYKFLKNKALDVRLSVNDVLNQNSGLSRTVSQAYVENDRTQVLKRYGLLTVTWTLRYFKKPGGGYKETGQPDYNTPTPNAGRRGTGGGPDGPPPGGRPGGGDNGGGPN